jgi:hypothetical protein
LAKARVRLDGDGDGPRHPHHSLLLPKLQLIIASPEAIYHTSRADGTARRPPINPVSLGVEYVACIRG